MTAGDYQTRLQARSPIRGRVVRRLRVESFSTLGKRKRVKSQEARQNAIGDCVFGAKLAFREKDHARKVNEAKS